MTPVAGKSFRNSYPPKGHFQYLLLLLTLGLIDKGDTACGWRLQANGRREAALRGRETLMRRGTSRTVPGYLRESLLRPQ